MKKIILIIKVMLASLIIAGSANAQYTADNIKDMVNAQSFVFEAQTASPASGNLKQLTPSYYTLSVSKDTVVADLPYYGRAYTAPIDPTQGGLQFKSTKFEYLEKAGRKGWNITIKPDDTGDAVQMYLSVFDNGSASLSISSANRQSISFNGFIRAKK